MKANNIVNMITVIAIIINASLAVYSNEIGNQFACVAFSATVVYIIAGWIGTRF